MVNKKSCITVLAVVLVFGLVLTNCDNGTTKSSASTKDSIKIISVDPSEGLTDLVMQEFKIIIEYVLVTQEQGEIMILFNFQNPDSYISIPGTNTVIDKGSGTLSFDVSSITKNWYSAGDFCVGVAMVPYPHPDSWDSLAGDRKVLSFK